MSSECSEPDYKGCTEPDYTFIKTGIPTNEHPINNLAVAALQEAASPLGGVMPDEYRLFKHARRMAPDSLVKVITEGA